MIAVLFITFTGMMGVQSVPPVLPTISSALIVSDAQIGFVMTAFFLPAAVMIPITGVAADLYGRRIVVLSSLLVFGLAGTSVFFIESFWLLLVLRGLQGIAFPGIIPLSITITGDFYSGATGTTAQGLRMAINGFGSTIAPILAGILAGIAWNYPFLLFAIAFPVLAFVYVSLPESAADSRSSITTRKYLQAIASELRSIELLILLLGAFAVFFARFGLITFIPLFAARSLGASPFVVGLLIAIFGGMRAVIPLLTGPLAIRFQRRTVIVTTVSLSGVSAAVMSITDTVGLLAVLIGLFGTGTALFTPFLNDTVTAMASTEHRAGVVSSMEITKTGALAISPVFFGLVLAATEFTVLFLVAAAVLFTYAVIGLIYLDTNNYN